MKYPRLALLLFNGIVCHLYPVEMQERHLKALIGPAAPLQSPPQFYNQFGLKWEKILQPVKDTKSFVRPLTNALALISESGRIFAFDEKTGRPLRQIVFPSKKIDYVESLGNNRLAYAQNGRDVFNVITVGLNDEERSSVEQVPAIMEVYGLASIPYMKKLVVGGVSKNGPNARIIDFSTDNWQKERDTWAGDGLAESMSTLPGGNGLVGYRRRYDGPLDFNLNVYDAKAGFTQPIRVPTGRDIVAGEVIKGNNVLMWVRKNGGYSLRLFRDGRDLNIEFSGDRSDPGDLLDEGRGTIVVGLNKEITTLNTSGRILQKFSTGGFDIQSVKYIEEKDGRDLIAVTSLDGRMNRLKLSVLGLKSIKARL